MIRDVLIKLSQGLSCGLSDFSVEIHEQRIAQGNSYIQSHAYEAVIKDFDDLLKIRMSSVRYDEQTTSQRVQFARNYKIEVMDRCRLNYYGTWRCTATDRLGRNGLSPRSRIRLRQGEGNDST